MKSIPPEINILSQEVANKVAAGEVVERPSAIVKELIENSIDAHADKIEVEFSKGGKSFIKITDNGHGMTASQAMLCIKPHSTSKITKIEDIFKISSYGFRGEALASISSVSIFCLRTRCAQAEFGTQIEINGNKVESVKECVMPVGTQIIVEDLFFNVPARRKFLKSDNVEASHIIKLCKLYAVGIKNLNFTLLENGRKLFSVNKTDSLMMSIKNTFPKEIANNLIEFSSGAGRSYEVYGGISNTLISFASNRNVYAFINGRPVECRQVYSALKEAYSQFLPIGKYPSAFLFIKADFKDVDVNVHPQKREVRLKDEFFVRNFLYEKILEALRANLLKDKQNSAIIDISSKNDDFVKEPNFEPAQDKNFEIPKPVFLPPKSPNIYKSQDNPVRISDVEKKSLRDDVEEEATTEEPNPNTEAKSNLEQDWQFLSYYKGRYILFQTQSGLSILSIISALRRINYTKILNSVGDKVPRQGLLIPVNLEFEAMELEVFLQNKTYLENAGFSIEDFGNGVYRVREIPAWLDFSDVKVFINDLIEVALSQNSAISNTKEQFAKNAVKRITMKGFEATKENAQNLLNNLFLCENHLSCTEGRACMRQISDADLLKMFGA